MLGDFKDMLLSVPPVLFALTVHECSHAWVAYKLGDPTAKVLGRVSLNPIRHLDPIGTIALFFSGLFGWAKPVPVNPMNFKDPGKAMMYVALAGPLSNLMLAAISAVLYKFLFVSAAGGAGLEGIWVYMPGVFKPLNVMVQMSIVLNISLATFNLIPIPPLDGSRVLSNLLPFRSAFAFAKIERYGFVILIILIMTGVIHRIISPVISLTANLLMGGYF